MPTPRRRPSPVQAPDLESEELERLALPKAEDDGGLEIEGARIEDDGASPLAARRLTIRSSELSGVTFAPANFPGMWLGNVRLANCDLSNVHAREGALQRVEITRSRLLGFNLTNARVRDLDVRDSVLALAGFASAKLRNVRFERVNLSEASFLEAQLENVSFVDCQLEGADFRGVRLRQCVIRGSSLDGILGLTSLRGIEMPWPDVLGSAAAMAAALGIEVEGQD